MTNLRRNERDWSRAVLLAAVVAGAAAAASRGMSPTGSSRIDFVESALLGGLVALAAVRCPWAVPAAAGAGAALFAPTSMLAVVGAFAGVLGVLGHRREGFGPSLRAVSAAGTVAVLVRLDWPRTLGGPSLLAGFTMCAILGPGLWRSPWVRKRRVLLAVGTVGVVVVASTAVTAAAGWLSRSDLRTGRQTAEVALDAVSGSRFDEARSLLAISRAALSRVDDRMSSPFTRLAAVVPVVAQHRRLGTDLSGGSARLSAALESTLRAIDAKALQPVRGSVNLDAVAKIEPPMAITNAAALDLQVDLRRTLSNPWLAEPIRRRLLPIAQRIDRAADDSSTGLLAARAGRTLLGGDGTRRYLVLFMTPAESRGLGGYAGNFAELTATNGRLQLAEFGRIGELVKKRTKPIELRGTPDWRVGWGRFGGVNGPGGVMIDDFWQNITLPPDLPTVGAVAAELYPQTGGSAIDGVLAVDPQGLSALLRLTGPVSVPEIGRTLSADNAPEFILRDQYRQFNTNDTRVDALESVALAATEALLGGADLPELPVMAKLLGPAARTNHLTMWSRHPDEQRLLERLRVDNSFRWGSGTGPARPADPTAARQRADWIGNDLLAVTAANASGTKLDAFMTRSVTYDVTIDPTDGSFRGRIVVELRNDAPPMGLPDYVYGNLPDDSPDRGRARTLLAVYTAAAPTAARIDGTYAPADRWTESGREVTALDVRTAPGATSRIELDVAGRIPVAEGYRLRVRGQTSATTPDVYRVTVRSTTATGPLVDDQRGIEGFARWDVVVG